MLFDLQKTFRSLFSKTVFQSSTIAHLKFRGVEVNRKKLMLSLRFKEPKVVLKLWSHLFMRAL